MKHLTKTLFIYISNIPHNRKKRPNFNQDPVFNKVLSLLVLIQDQNQVLINFFFVGSLWRAHR